MKGFTSELSVTISRKQMVEIYQDYYDEIRNEALENLKFYNEQYDEQYNQLYIPPTVPDDIKFNNVILYEYNNAHNLHFEDVISGKGENESISHFCNGLLTSKFVQSIPRYQGEFFYDITESKDVYGHFMIHCHGLSPTELCKLIKFLDK